MISSIVVFIIVLSVLVLVHELGHFLVAKKFGIWVEEFGFGLPPKIFGKKIKETIYSLNLLPFGGFVRLHGELTDNKITNKKRAFIYKSKKIKIAVITAGVIMNFLLAIVAFATVYSFTGIPREIKEVKILDVASGSPAQIAKILPGDRVLAVDGQKVNSVSEFVEKIENKKGIKTTLQLQDRKILITPRSNPPEGEGALGIAISNTEMYFAPVWQRPFWGIYYGFKEALFWGKNVFLGLGSIFTSLFKGQTPSDVSGPIGVFAVTSEVSKQGIFALLNLLGIISVNLAVVNILPFPALDGGRLLFIFIEKLIGKKVVPKVEGIIHSVGMIILLALILLITIHDIQRLIFAGSISNFLNSMVK